MDVDGDRCLAPCNAQDAKDAQNTEECPIRNAPDVYCTRVCLDPVDWVSPLMCGRRWGSSVLPSAMLRMPIIPKIQGMPMGCPGCANGCLNPVSSLMCVCVDREQASCLL